MIRIKAYVQGHVQGVGYRYFVHHTAQRLPGIGGGYVKNLSDGRVEVEAEALERPALEALIHELRTGPSAAQVTGVTTQWEDNVEGKYVSFRVA